MKGRLCYISRNYRGVEGSGNKAKTDNEDTLEEMGAVNLGLHRTLYNNKVVKFLLDLLGILLYCLRVRRNDIILLQYPVKKYFSFICHMAHLRGAKVITLIHDLGSMRRKKLTVEKEIDRLMHADYVIASNGVMQQWLKEHGYKNQLGALGLFDYRSHTVHQESSTPREDNEHTLVYAGALAMRKNAFILQLPDVIKGYKLHIYGNRSGLPTLKESPQLIFHNFMPADQFIESAEGDFGFVWDGDTIDSCTGNFGEYLRWNSPHKVSFYLRAGMPIIIWKEAALAGLIQSEGIGLCISSIEELNTLLPQVTSEQMNAMRARVRMVSDRLAHGEFFKHALEKALSDMHQE